ncbi:MAG: IS110 family transposase [Methylocella sp.]
MQSAEFAAYVGLDWEHGEHAVCLFPAAGGTAQHGEVKQTPEGIAAWVVELRERFGGQPVAICLEQSRGALVYALMPYDFLVLYPINPKQLSDYREALYPSGAKSDPTDAELLARFLRDHTDKLRAWRPDDAITRGLRLMTEQRRNWVQDRVALTNELQQRLKESYVLALDLCGNDLASERSLALLEKFPSQRELQRASPKQLEKSLRPRRRVTDDPPAEEMLREQIAAIRKATPMTTDCAVLEHARLVVANLVVMIRTLNQAIAQCDTKIDELFAQHPDRELFDSFPGAGKALAPRLAAAYGTDRDKFQGAQDMQQFSGIAPVTRASGKTKVAHMRWACPKFLRQTFHEFARCSIKFSPWAKAYVAMRTASGHRYHETVRALAFKWQRILFQCWKTRQPYDEKRYLQRLHATGSKIIQFLPPDLVPTT